jgi:CRP-like cAMP-binding protein
LISITVAAGVLRVGEADPMTSTVSDAGRLKAPLIAKIERFVALTPVEKAFLEAMQDEFVRMRPGADIVSAGHRYRCFFVLNQGMAIRYKVLHDGRRQVLGLILPGDVIGFPGVLFDTALYSIASLGPSIACPIPFTTVFDLFRGHPKLASALFWLVGHEAALFAEHLVGVGRQSAYERVAHLILELLLRLQIIGQADAQSYVLPLTQELMADMLGLSVPHVNRTLRRLREDRLISFDGNRVTCHDVAALSRLADFDTVNFARQRVPDLEAPPEFHAASQA